MRAIRFRNCLLWFLPAVLVAGLAAWVFREPLLVLAGRLLIRSDVPQKADLIYVLAGDFWGSRVLTAADLGAHGYARRVLLSGGPYADRFEGDMAADFAVEHGYPRTLFLTLRLDAQSTLEEARAVGPAFRSLAARRIILVTSNFHSRRAALVFRLAMPDIQFFMVAAPDRNFDPSAWWKTPRGRGLLFSELQKIAGTLLHGAGLLGLAAVAAES